jgi:hypothetical protein
MAWKGAFHRERCASLSFELGMCERLMIQVKKPNGAITKPMIPMSSTCQFKGGKI